MDEKAFFKNIAKRLRCDESRAEGVAFAVFQELRDRLTPKQASHVEAQLAKPLKTLMAFSGETRPKRPQSTRTTIRWRSGANGGPAGGRGRTRRSGGFRRSAKASGQSDRSGRGGLGRFQRVAQGSEAALDSCRGRRRYLASKRE